MAVPSTHTVAVGDKQTAADENTYVRDAVGFYKEVPRVFVYQGTTGTTAGTSGTAALVLWDTEQYDTDTMHSTSTNTSRLVATTVGTYDVKVCVVWAANATGWRQVEIRKNAAGSSSGGTAIAQFRVPATATLAGLVFGSVDAPLAATDYLECFVTQTSGGSLATTVGQSFTWASMRWVAAT